MNKMAACLDEHFGMWAQIVMNAQPEYAGGYCLKSYTAAAALTQQQLANP